MRESKDGGTIFQYEFLRYLKSQEAMRSWTNSMKKSFKEAKSQAVSASFDGKSKVEAKSSIDFSERIETNTTGPQEIVPTIADIDESFLEIEFGKDLLTSTDTAIGLSYMQNAGFSSTYKI